MGPEAAPREKKKAKNNKKSKQDASSWMDRVTDVFHYICTFLTPADTLQLSRCKRSWTLVDLGRGHVALWRPQARALLMEHKLWTSQPALQKRLQLYPRNYKAVVALLTDRGCERCHTSRIRKVVWEFGCRFCKECLYGATIAEYYLKTLYDCSPARLIYADLPSTEATTWNRWSGAREITFYWRASIDVRLRLHGRPSLKEQDDIRKVSAEEARASAALRAEEERVKAAELESLRVQRKASILAILHAQQEKDSEEKEDVHVALNQDILCCISADYLAPLFKKPELLQPLEAQRLEKRAPQLLKNYHTEVARRLEVENAKRAVAQAAQAAQAAAQARRNLEAAADTAARREIGQRLYTNGIFKGASANIQTIGMAFSAFQVRCVPCATERIFGLRGLVDHSASRHKNFLHFAPVLPLDDAHLREMLSRDIRQVS